MIYRVLITAPPFLQTIDPYRPTFKQHGIEITTPPVVQQLSEAELLEIIDQFDGVIAGDDPFTARVLEKGQKLKVVTRWGVGVDNVDREAAQRLGITVSNTPGAFSDEVADIVIGYIVMLARQLHQIDRSVRGGGWAKPRGVTLRSKTLGIIGLGNIGRQVALRAVALGMVPVGNDVCSPDQSFVDQTGLKLVTLDDLLRQSDFITLCCNLTPENHHLLDQKQFALMKQGVYLVNCSRGPLISESALAQALEEGKVKGAALDVFEVEPLAINHPLQQFHNCIFGSHNGSNTHEAVQRVNEWSIRNLLEGLGIKA